MICIFLHDYLFEHFTMLFFVVDFLLHKIHLIKCDFFLHDSFPTGLIFFLFFSFLHKIQLFQMGFVLNDRFFT